MKNEIAKFVQEQLPRHYIDENPRFLRLLENYYKWLNRKEGMSKEESEDVQANLTKWTGIDIDRFLDTKSARYTSFRGSEGVSIAEISRYRPPGAFLDRFHSQYVLEREYDAFVTADGDYFSDNNGAFVDSGFVLEEVIDNWSSKFNHTPFKEIDALNPHDEILLLKCMKMLYAAKGTQKCIKLFFKVYFDDDVDIYIPKFDICVVDGESCIDDSKYLRDDFRYQEFCYVIRTERDPAPYMDTFREVYIKRFHPGGFNVILEQKPS